MSRASVDRPAFRPHEHHTTAPVIGKVSRSEGAALPSHDLDRQPAVRAEAGAVGNLWVQACSIAGRSHTEGSSPSSGQDSYSYRLSDDGGVAVFAIADGLGSRPRSHVGAHVAAVQACVSFADPSLAHLFDGPPGRLAPDDAVLSAMNEVGAHVVASSAGGSAGHDVATTLLVAVLRLRGPRASAFFVRVGDPSALLTERGEFTARSLVFGAPPDGPANQLSSCLPMKDPAAEVEVVRVGELPDGVGVVLVTDGVGNDLAGSRELRDWFQDRWSAPLDAAGMIDSLRYRRQGSVDDRTALVVLPSPTSTRGLPAEPTLTAQALPPPPTVRQAGPAAVAAVTGPTPVRPPERVSGQRGWLLAALGALVVAAIVAAGVALTGGSESSAGGALPQWIGPGRAGPILIASDTAVQAVEVDNSAGPGWIVTSQSGSGTVAVDGCADVVPIADPSALPAQHNCNDPQNPTLAVPDGPRVITLLGDRLVVSGSPGSLDLSGVSASIRESAVDAALTADSAVVVGDGDVALVPLGGPAGAAVAFDDPTDACPDASYVAVESVASGGVALSASCADGRWAILQLTSTQGTPCAVYTGTGAPPVPVRLTNGSVVAAFGTSGPSGRLAIAPLGDGCR